MLNRIPIFWKLTVCFMGIILLVLITDSLFSRVDVLSGSKSLQFLLVVLMALVVSTSGAWFFVRRFVNQKVGTQLKGDEPDESGAIAPSFNHMASMLAASQAELQISRDYLEGILESTADIIITVNPEGRILSFNRGAERALGYERHEVIGQPIEMLFENPKEREYAIGQLEFADNLVNYETRFKTRDGAVRKVLLTLTRLRGSSGEVVCTFGISKDITREKRLQRELIQSQRLAAIGEVFTGVQHSLKNMLNACKGGAYMVRLGFRKDDRDMLSEGWDIVQEGITRMSDMSVDMLKYVREWKPKFERVDLGGILSEIDRVIAPTATRKEVKFSLDVPESLPLVSCDSGMIHSATMDIVSNALDACYWKDYTDDETPEVSLSAYSDVGSSMITLEVKDNGCGMSEEVKEMIFTPFFSTKSKTGTGLGLAITARMINAHGGRFEVDSEPDRGTIFRILLPINGINNNKESISGEESTNNR